MKTRLLTNSVLLASMTSIAIAGTPLEAARDVGWDAATDPLRGKAVIADAVRGSLRIASLDSLELSTTGLDGQAVRDVVVNAVIGVAYVLVDSGFVVAIDVESGRILRRGTVAGSATHLTADFMRGELYVSKHGEATVAVVHARTLKTLAEIAVAGEPGPSTLDNRRGILYIVSATGGTVDVVDVDGRSLLARVSVGSNPGSAAIDEVTGKVYVNNVDDRTISVIDPATFVVTRTLAAGAGSTRATVSAVHRRYYLPSADDGRLSVIDMRDDTIIAVVPIGGEPYAAKLSATEDEVVVLTRHGAAAAIVDAATARVSRKLPSAAGARSIVLRDRLITLREPGTEADAGMLATTPIAVTDTALATEYVDARQAKFMHTANDVEARLLADGLYGEQWKRTLRFFRVWTAPSEDRVPVCQFSRMSDNAVDRVFSLPSECARLETDMTWTYEGTAYYVALPDANGHCAAGAEALHRLYTIGADGVATHRYVTHTGERDTLIASGWTAEGSGEPAVFACVPKLAREGVSSPTPELDERVRTPRIPPLPLVR